MHRIRNHKLWAQLAHHPHHGFMGPDGPSGGCGPQPESGPGPHQRYARAFGGGLRGPRHGRRARRGQLRDSVLRLLAEQPLNGYQIMTTLSEKTLGAWQPSPGAVYPCLSQLEDEGLIIATDNDGQKVFSVTEAGQAAADQIVAEPWSGPSKFSSAHHKTLFEQFHSLAITVRFAGQTANQAQVAAIAEQLETTRKTILAIMAEAE